MENDVGTQSDSTRRISNRCEMVHVNAPLVGYVNKHLMFDVIGYDRRMALFLYEKSAMDRRSFYKSASMTLCTVQ